MRETVEIRILPLRLPSILRDENDPRELERSQKDGDEPTVGITVVARLKRTGMETRLLIDGADARREPDHSLRRLLAQAHQYNAM